MGIEKRANREAPAIATPQSSLVFMPLTQRFAIQFASAARAAQARYANRYAEDGVSLAALLGDIEREKGKFRR